MSNSEVGFSTRISELVSALDAQMGTVTDSATGNSTQFQFGRILESLLDSGLDFYSALTIIGRIEHRMQPNMETKEISSWLGSELDAHDAKIAKEFRTKYDDGIELRLDGSTTVPLSMSSVRDYAANVLNALGYTWDRLLPQVTRSLSIRCRKLGMREIPAEILDHLVMQELSDRLGGITLDEFRTEMPSMVATAIATLRSSIDGENTIVCSCESLAQVGTVCKALLFYYGVIPPLEVGECLLATVMLFDKARDPQHLMRTSLMDFRAAIGSGSCSAKFLEGRKCPEDFLVEHAKATLRRLSVLVTKQASTQTEAVAVSSTPQDMMHDTLWFLADFVSYLWPEDWLAASTLQQVRSTVLRDLFRYRCLSVTAMTRLLQVHPKHTVRALTSLQREGFVQMHRLQDGELVLITARGEGYCEHNLGLRLRYSLSSM
jgi:hypothetical protein